MFSSLATPENITRNNVSATMFPSLVLMTSRRARMHAQGAHTNCVTVCILNFSIEEMYENVEHPRIILLDCDQYSHLTSKQTYFYLKCCVLSFLRLKTAIFSDLKGSATDVHSSVIAKTRRLQPQERQYTTF